MFDKTRTWTSAGRARPKKSPKRKINPALTLRRQSIAGFKMLAQQSGRETRKPGRARPKSAK